VSPVVIRETVRRHFTNAAFLVVLGLLTLGAAATGAAGAPSQAWQVFTSLFAVVLGCQIIGPEFSSGTLQLILAKPVRRADYLVSRVAGVTLVLWGVLWVPIAAEVVARLLLRREAFDWLGAVSGVTHLSAEVFFVCAILTMFGSMVRSYFNVAIYVGIQMLIGLLLSLINNVINSSSARLDAMRAFFRARPEFSAALRAIDRNLYPDPPSATVFDRAWLALVLSNAAVALLLACILFRRREVPYGAD
jgi:ABC-type transport system involved in multi-copper enzyme maturation permease subunit